MYILQSLMDLYLIVFAIRLSMQWVRADFRNPIVQFVLTVTNPLVAPVRKILAPIGKLDTATVAVYVGLLWLFTAIILQISCAQAPDVLSLLGIAVIRGLRLIITVYFYMIIGYVILSWVTMMMQGGNYNSALATFSNLLNELVQPVLLPFRKFIPLIGGLDLSPIVLLLLMGGVQQMLDSFSMRVVGGAVC